MGLAGCPSTAKDSPLFFETERAGREVPGKRFAEPAVQIGRCDDHTLYDCVIVGGSFAGLATALQLRGLRVLIVDRYPIGAHQTSACATALATIRAVGAESAVLEEHTTVFLHAAGRRIPFTLEDPFVTFDYQRFCQAMLAQTDAEVRLARANGYRDGMVLTDQGAVRGRFIVDAAGWGSVLGHSLQAPQSADVAGYAVETELPVRPDLPPGLHFFFVRRYVPRGYAWVFPCGEFTRFGVGSSLPGVNLRGALRRFLADFGLRAGRTHGGMLTVGFYEPVVGDIFIVGDAAGQCLPLTGEGIRTALYHGLHCGHVIRRALQGELTPSEARALYRQMVIEQQRTHRHLLFLQRLVEWAPEPMLAWSGRLAAYPKVTRWVLRRYLGGTGWFLGLGHRQHAEQKQQEITLGRMGEREGTLI